MVQIDMEVPENCSDCPMNYDMIFCSISNTKMNWDKMDKERLQDCPLKEVKENNDKSEIKAESEKSDADSD